MSRREFWHPPHVREIRHHQREEAERRRDAKPSKLAKPKPLRCSFCFKSEAEVAPMPVWPSEGKAAAICGECHVRGYEQLKKLKLLPGGSQ